jgi:hypothetical protein
MCVFCYSRVSLSSDFQANEPPEEVHNILKFAQKFGGPKKNVGKISEVDFWAFRSSPITSPKFQGILSSRSAVIKIVAFGCPQLYTSMQNRALTDDPILVGYSYSRLLPPISNSTRITCCAALSPACCAKKHA